MECAQADHVESTAEYWHDQGTRYEGWSKSLLLAGYLFDPGCFTADVDHVQVENIPDPNVIPRRRNSPFQRDGRRIFNLFTKFDDIGPTYEGITAADIETWEDYVLICFAVLLEREFRWKISNIWMQNRKIQFHCCECKRLVEFT